MATIKDVANHAGVSVTTVSYFLNNKKKLKDETREKILLAIKETGYRYNSAAGSLKKNRDAINSVGVISIVDQNPFFSQLFFELEKRCYANGYSVISCFRHDSESDLKSYIEMMSGQVDAIVLITIDSNTIEPVLKQIHSTPIVPVSFDLNDVNTMCGGTTLNVNNHTGGYIAGRYLVSKGHKKFACLSGPVEFDTTKDRNDGFLKALHEKQLSQSDVLLFEGDYTYDCGFEMMSKLFSEPELPTAVFCHNDLMAIGVQNAAHELGVKVPEELSVIGYDNIAQAKLSYPTLTTINIPLDDLAKQVVSALELKYTSKNYHAEITTVPNLVIRKSVV